MRPIKFSVGLPNGDFKAIATIAKRAEELGYYGVSLDDHFFMRGFMADPTQPHLECYTTLSAIAAVTKSIRIAPLVTALSYRSPALLAKMIATLDNISGGRLIAGVGAGWFKEEYDAYNYPYPSNAERIEQLAEGVKVLKAMWTENEPTFHGRHFSIDKAYCYPRPLQKPYPPIMIGGGGKKILKLAAEEADILNLNPPVTRGVVDIQTALKFDKNEVRKRLAMLKEFAKAAGRSTDSVEFSAMEIVIGAKDKATAEMAIKMIAQTAGVSDTEQARTSPQLLVGTYDEIKRELAWRIENFEMTHFFLNFLTPDGLEAFAKEVMPSFIK